MAENDLKRTSPCKFTTGKWRSAYRTVESRFWILKLNYVNIVRIYLSGKKRKLEEENVIDDFGNEDVNSVYNVYDKNDKVIIKMYGHTC